MKILLPGLLAILLLAACGPAEVPPVKNAEFYFKEGEMYFEKGHYQDAIHSWEKVRESFYSPELTALAEMKMAEAHFKAKEYPEAAAAFEEFLKQYPGHERAAQILFQLGLAHYRQILDLDRDQTSTNNALATMNNFLARYPGDPNAEEARRIIRECRERLAAHELYVGRYYLRAGLPLAAIRRLETIPSRFPEFSGRDETYFYLGQSYLRAGKREAAEKTFAALDQEFPQSDFVAKAHKAMAKDD